MKGVKCVAPVFDLNGYGQWSRGYILALIRAGIPVTIFPVSFDPGKNKVELGKDGELLAQHVNTGIEYDTCIAWLVPDIAKKVFDQEPAGIRKVSMSLWETLNLPSSWLKSFEQMDDIWVCGEFGRDVYQRSIDKAGLKKTVQIVPYPIDSKAFEDTSKLDFSSAVPGKDFSDYYKFYYISQWNFRKNFQDLLLAYWHEFSKDDKVLLVLKTYINDQSDRDKTDLQNLLASIGKQTNKPDRAPVVLLHGAFSSEKMVRLHNSCDCFVSPSRGEGLGLGMIEAGLSGNEIISHSFGEQATYLKHIYDYPHSLSPVTGMQGYTWYNISQIWAAPDVWTMGYKMRISYMGYQQNGNVKDYRNKAHLTSKFTEKVTSDRILELLS